MQCQKKLKPSRDTALLQSRRHTCFAGEREGERDGMGWVRLLGELDPDPGSESVSTKKALGMCKIVQKFYPISLTNP
jgi:hypothetical protein